MLVQLSDPHIGAAWSDDRDPASMLGRAVDAVLALAGPVDAVLVSGDLAEHGAAAEYELAQRLLAPLGAVPVHVLPGNHDDRAELRRGFGLPGAGDEPIHYVAEAGGLRLAVLDSHLPGSDGGDLDAGQLAWLEAELRAAPDAPTVIAMHHPPALGVPAFDRIALAPAASAALGELLAAHPQVVRVLAGHVHAHTVVELAGRPVVTAPSVYMQAALDPGNDAIDLLAAPGGFLVHELHAGGLASLARTF